MGTYLSLFTGIGGLDLAVERALGFRCVGQVEFDRACSAVLERWWPGVPRWGDVHGFSHVAYTEGQRRSTGDLASSNVEHDGLQPAYLGEGPDLICAGYPCQPFSTAGRRAGTDDPRHLWPEVARLAGELRPRWLLLENVSGHLSLGGHDVLRDLAALGYDATWTTVRAADVGAPHRRERWFCLATDTTERDGSIEPAFGAAASRGRRTSAQARGRGSHASLTDRIRQGRETPLRPSSITGVHASEAGAEPSGADRGRVATNADGGPLTGSGAAGNGLPEPPERRDGDASNPDDPRGHEAGEGDEGRGLSPDGRGFPWGPYGPAIRRWEAVMGPAPHPVDEKNRLSPPFVEWMMGFPAGWTEGMSRTQALKALGNAVVPAQGALAIRTLLAMEAVA